jgi:phosphoheptose isomerase
MGIFTLGFTGTEGELKDLVDICLKVNSKNTQHIQEIHQVAYHALAGLVENQMC